MDSPGFLLAKQPSSLPESQRVRSALFLDFDNIYLCIADQDPEAAKGFGENPQRWLRWLRTLSFAGLLVQRDILIRRCYLNPGPFGKMRPYFIAAGFEVVDCPSLTRRGKNSADILIVMDMLDALGHSTHFDEFILLSGDADFTPILRRLRAHDRRSLVVAAGPTATAYTAVCDHLVPQDDFLEAVSPPVVIPRPAKPAAKPSTPSASARLTRAKPPESSTESAKGTSRHEHAQQTLPVEPPIEESVVAGEFQTQHPELYELALSVQRVTKTPLLLPKKFRLLFEEIAKEINANGFKLSLTSRNVRDQCHAHGSDIARHTVNFMLRGIGFAGHRLDDPAHRPENPDVLAKCFTESVITSCQTAQMELSEEQIGLLRRWIATP